VKLFDLIRFKVKGGKIMAKEKRDLSKGCNFDDDSDINDCFNCIYFLFPIGCMYGEDMNEQENKKEKD